MLKKFSRRICGKVGERANDAEISPEDVQKHLLATTDFVKGMQDDIDLYVTHDRLNSASFR